MLLCDSWESVQFYECEEIKQKLAKILYCIVGKFDELTVDDVCVKLNPINITIFASTKFVR